MACESLVWAGSRMLFKNNPGKEENMHRGSETKFPWWYFLHTGGILAGQWGAAYQRERRLPCTHKDVPLSFCLLFPRHFQSLLLLLPLPLLTSQAPPNLLPSCTPLSTSPPLSCFSLSTIPIYLRRALMWIHCTHILKRAHSHWPYTVPHLLSWFTLTWFFSVWIYKWLETKCYWQLSVQQMISYFVI